MDPFSALAELAALLERERSSRYKSKAFRVAADAIAGLSDEQLRDAATLLHANAFHMSVAAEPLAEALARISASDSAPRSVKRLGL